LSPASVRRYNFRRVAALPVVFLEGQVCTWAGREPNELKKEPKMIELGAEVIDVKAEGFKYIVTLDSGVKAFGLQVRCVKEASVFGGRSCDSRNRGS
jgi:hypothetical protein